MNAYAAYAGKFHDRHGHDYQCLGEAGMDHGALGDARGSGYGPHGMAEDQCGGSWKPDIVVKTGMMRWAKANAWSYWIDRIPIRVGLLDEKKFRIYLTCCTTCQNSAA